MNVDEMKYEFLVLYDKITNFAAPGYEDEEISVLLTKAQEETFLEIIGVLKDKYRRGFESTEKRRKDLSNITRSAILAQSANQADVLENGIFFDLPADVAFVIGPEQATVTSTDPCLDGTMLSVLPYTHDKYSANIKNPFKKPTTNAWRLDFEDRHELILPGSVTAVTEYKTRYIKRPQPILLTGVALYGAVGPLDSELGEYLHRSIITHAVRIATGVTNPQEYQIKQNEQLNSE